MKIYFTVYQTTNLINGKVYIGAHKTSDLEDDYYGSGKHLNHAIDKYGKENFEKEILAIFDNQDEMWNMESVLVNEEFVKRKDTYNLKEGGQGGAMNMKETEYYKSGRMTEHNRVITKKGLPLAQERLCYLRGNDPAWVAKAKTNMRDSIVRRIADGTRIHGFSGKTHSEETKLRMSKKHKGKRAGDKNGQFGTRWITHPVHGNKKISESASVPEGWVFGRTVSDTPERKEKKRLKEFKNKKVLSERNKKRDIIREERKAERKQARVECRRIRETELKVAAEERSLRREQEALLMYQAFIDSESRSLRAFCNDTEYDKSVMTLSNYFRKYVPGYAESSIPRVKSDHLRLLPI